MEDLPRIFDILSYQPNGISIVDQNFEVLFWNKCLENWSGIKSNEIVGKKLTDIYPNLSKIQYVDRFKKVLDGGPAAIFSSQIHGSLFPCDIGVGKNKTTQKQRCTVRRINPLKDEKPFLMFSVDDVTGLTEQISELDQLMELKDQFLSMCSHDLKTPLISIIGYSELLLESESNEQKRQDLLYIHQSGKFLNYMINELLDLQKIKNQKHTFSLDALEILNPAQESLKHAEGLAKSKGVNLILENMDSLKGVKILGDHVSLVRCFNNLLSNAIKFTNPLGNVTFQCGQENEQVVIKIQDTGIGIPSEKIPNLFDEFSISSRSGTAGEKGTGLGLNITHGLIKAHRGKIKVESEVNVGSTFKIYVPIFN